ncbi:MAG: type II and III secretion system protein [Kosmotoga sp.]|nr:MAG: type II and III secretion system protein [Kosmotoga sp.]
MRIIKLTTIWFFVTFALIAGTLMAGTLETIIPDSSTESVNITFVFSSKISKDDITFNHNPSKTIYSLEIKNVTGKNMDLPLRNGPVEGMWTRMLENDRFMINVALLIPAKEEPEMVIEEEQITLKFWRSSKKVSIDRFKAYGMDIKSVISYLFGTDLLNLPYVVTPTISNIKVNVGFSSTYPEDVLRNVLISLGNKIGYAYLTDGTFYIGSPEEVTDVVNAFWKTYTGVNIKSEDGTISELDKIRNKLPIEAYLEYLPNMSTLLAFGDLETHMMLSEMLTSSYVTKEYSIDDNLSDSIDYNELVAFGKQIARLLCEDDVSIEAIPQLSKLILSGKDSDVDRVIKYMNQYITEIRETAESDELRRIEITLPENFRIIEELMNIDILYGSNYDIRSSSTYSSDSTYTSTTSEGTESESPEATLSSDSRVDSDTTMSSVVRNRVTLVDSITQLLNELSKDGKITVDRTFEFSGRVTFIIPSRLTSVLTDIVSDLKKKAQLIGYDTLKDVGVLDKNILEEVERLTGIIIEPLGNRMGYLLKGRKDKIDVAKYLISQFGGYATKMDSRFIELRNSEAFESVKTFLTNFFASEGLDADSYTVEKITNELVFISAPSDLLASSLEKLNRYEEFFFKERIQQTQQIEQTVFNSGVKQILDSFFSDEVLYSYVPSAELLIIFGEKNVLNEVNNLLDTVITRIEEKQKMQEESISANRTSRLIPFIPSWDSEKFSSYMEDFLGNEAYQTIKIVKSGTGYLVVGNEKTIDLVEKEAERIREMQNPYYAVVRQIPPISELTNLFSSLGINIEILPVESKFIFLGPREQVLKAQEIVDEVNKGIGVSEEGGRETEKIIYDFLSIDEKDISSMEQIFEKLSIGVELISSPGGVLAIGTKEEIDKSKDLVKSIRERKPVTEDIPEDVVYRVLPLEENINIEDLQKLSGQLAYDAYIVKLANSLVVVGNKDEVENFILFYENIIKKERGELKVVDRKLPFEQLANIVDTLGLNIEILETGEKYLFYGDNYAISSLELIIKEVTADGTDSTPQVKTREVKLVDTNIEKETLSVIADDLGLSLSLHSYDNQIVVIGDSQSLDYFINVVKNLQTEKGRDLNYRLIKNKKLPSVDELREIFEGIKSGVSIKTVGDYLALIGSETDIKKALELIDKVSYKAEEISDGEDIERSYSLLKVPEGFDIEDLQVISERIGIKVDIIPTGVAALAIGEKDSIASLNNVLSTMYDFGEKSQGVRYSYEIVDIPTNLTLNEIKELFDTVGLEINLLEITGKIVLVGIKQDISDGLEIIGEFTPEITGDATEINIERKKEILLFDTTIGLTELKDLIDKIEIEISVSTVGTQFVAVGYPEELNSFEGLLEKLRKIEPDEDTKTKTAGYIIVEKPLALSQQTIEELFSKINLDLQIQEFDSKLVLIGSNEQLVKARVFLKDLKEQEESTKEEIVPEPEKGYLFTSIPEKTTVEEIRNVLRKLEVDVELVVAGDSLVITGITENITKANDILSNLREMLTSPETAKLIYDVIPYPSDIDISVVKDALDSLKVEGELLKSDGKLLLIGSSTEIDKIKNLIEMLKPEVDEDGKEAEEKVEKEIKLFDTAIGLSELTQLIKQLGMEVAASAIGTQYVAVGDRETLDKFDKLLEQLKVIEPTEESTEVELEYRITEKPEMVTAEALSSLFEKIKLDIGVMGFENTIVMVGAAKDLDRAEVFIEDLRKQEKAEEEQIKPEPEKGYVFTPIPEGTTIEELQSAMRKINIEVELIRIADSVMMVGIADELKNAQEVITTLGTLETAAGEIKLDYRAIEYPEGLSLETLKEALNNLNVDARLLRSNNTLLIMGTKPIIEETLRLVDLLKPEKDLASGETTYSIKEYMTVTLPDDIDVAGIRTIMDKIGIKVEAISVDNVAVLIGEKAMLDLAGRVVNMLQEVKQKPAEAKVIYDTFDFPEDVDMNTLKTALSDLNIEAQLLKTNKKLLLIGTESEIKETKNLIEMLKPEVDEEGKEVEEKVEKEIMLFDTAIGLSELTQLTKQVGMEVAVSAIGTQYVAVGDRETLDKFDELLKRLKVIEPTEESTEVELEYRITEKPEMVTAEALSSLFEKIKLDIGVMGFENTVVMVGAAKDLDRAEVFIEDLRKQEKAEEEQIKPEPEKGYVFTPIPEGTTIEELQSILMKVELEAELAPAGKNAIIIGTEDQITEAQNVIATMSRLGKEPQELVRLNYELIKDTPAVSLSELKELMNKVGVSIDIMEISGKFVLIGTTGEIERGKQIIETFAPEKEEETKEATPTRKEIMVFETTLNYENMTELINNLGLEIAISRVDNQFIAVGTTEALTQLENLNERLKSIEQEDMEYVVTNKITGIDASMLNDLFEKLGLKVTAVEFDGTYILIGSKEDLKRSESFMNDLGKQEELKTDTVEPEPDKGYAFSKLPANTNFEDLQTMLRKLEIKIELVRVGENILLIGTAKAIKEAQLMISTLNELSAKGEEVPYTYRIITKPAQITGSVLNDIISNLKLDISVVTVGNSYMLIGTDQDLSKIKPVIEEFEVEDKELVPKTEDYVVLNLPDNVDSQQLENVLQSLNISVNMIPMDGIAVLTGESTALNNAQSLMDHLRKTTASTETGQIEGTQVRYSIMEIPADITVQDIKSISDVLKLELSFQEIGNRMIVAGNDSDINRLQEVTAKLSEKTDGTSIRNMELLQKIPGVQAETMLNYLITKGITLDGLYEIGNSYLAIGTKSMLEKASESIEYLATSSRGYYEIIELPSKFPMNSLEEIISQLSLSVSLIPTSGSNVVAIGNEENVSLLKEIIGSTIEIGAEIKYDVVDVPESLDSERIQEIINGLGLELTNLVLDNKVLLIGDTEEVETASKAIKDISSQFSSQLTDITELETLRLPSVSGWDLESIKEYLKAADVNLKEIFSYNTILIGLGSEEELKAAKQLLSFLVEEGSTTYRKIDKLDIEHGKLDSIIGNLGVSVNYVALDGSWLFTGPEKDLERFVEALEGLEMDRKQYTEYIKNITLSSDELEGFVSTSYPEIEFTYLENLKLVILKSEDKTKLEEARKQIIELHDELLEKDLDKKITFEDEVISINVSNEDLQSVVMHVASKLNKSVVFSENLDLKLSMFLSEVTWEEFLDTISSSTPIKYEKIGKVYNIYRHKVTEPTESATEEQIYKVQHNQQEIKQLLEFYGATVHLDEINGIMVVKNIRKTKVQEIFDQMGETVNSPKKQVRIETRLVDKSLVDEAIRDLSAEISFGEPKLSVNSDSIGLQIKLLDAVEFDKLLQKMLTTGEASISASLSDMNNMDNIISQPSIIAMDGEQAKIHIGESIPLTKITRDPETGDIIEEQVWKGDVPQYLESGVDLNITPMINDDGTIVLELDIKVGEPTKYETSKGNTFWGENARQATTKLTIRDGNTLTIGGLVEETEKDNVTKMPFLGDLPFIGKFFSSTTKTSDKRELVIFITAKVVEP